MGKYIKKGLGEGSGNDRLSCDFAVAYQEQIARCLPCTPKDLDIECYEQYHPLGIVSIISALTSQLAYGNGTQAISMDLGDCLFGSQ